MGVQRSHNFFRNDFITDKRVSWDGVHQKKSDRDHAPEGKKENQKFFYEIHGLLW
jgi:hypothetical protein